MTTIEDIIRIAVAAHDGQKDMVGNPAILHVLAVGLMGATIEEKKRVSCTTSWRTRTCPSPTYATSVSRKGSWRP